MVGGEFCYRVRPGDPVACLRERGHDGYHRGSIFGGLSHYWYPEWSDDPCDYHLGQIPCILWLGHQNKRGILDYPIYDHILLVSNEKST